MKFTTTLLSIVALFFFTSVTHAEETRTDNSNNENYDFYYQDLVVSAYYSPLPNQVRYLRDSYESDVRLNGNGTNGADGTEVFMGMLAAPKSYAFGTQIEIPGLGIGEVHDRGGAIIEKQGYHRIDVWMGYGDEGLTRALNWGMRKVTGKVFFEKNQKAGLDYTVVPAAQPQVAQAKAVERVAGTFTKNVELGQVDTQIPALKKLLNTLGYFLGEVDNNYFDEDLKASVIRFQIDQGIIASANTYEAGYVGSSTRKALEKALSEKPKTEVQTEKTENVQMAITNSLSKDSTGEDVKKLQGILAGLGYYQGPIDGVYSDDVMAAVFAFQKDSGILKSFNEVGAGHFGEKTKKALANALKEKEIKVAAFPVQKSLVLEGTPVEQSQVASATITPENISFPFTRSETLEMGEQGDHIIELQKALAEKGFLEYKYITGYFGPITAKAVDMAKETIIK